MGVLGGVLTSVSMAIFMLVDLSVGEVEDLFGTVSVVASVGLVVSISMGESGGG